MSSFISLLFGQQKVQIGQGVGGDFLPAGAIEFDAAIEEDHEAEVDVTKFPVEEGADVTDHLRPRPERITIQGIVSNTPLTLLSVEAARDITAYGKLKEIKDTGQLVSIVTSLRQYANMAIENFKVKRNASNGDNMNATVTLVEVFKAQVETATPAAAGGTSTTGPTSTGAQSTGAASSGQASRGPSALASAFGF